MTMLLPQAVRLRRAIEMWLTGNYLTAAEALQAGLVNHVVPHEELLPFPAAWRTTSSSTVTGSPPSRSRAPRSPTARSLTSTAPP
jgi:enoyl-CoA hydratase/carnithine racemase